MRESRHLTKIAEDQSTGLPIPGSLKVGHFIRLASRVGVWGLGGAACSFIAVAYGAPIPFFLASAVSGAGLIIGGVGAAAASATVLRELPAGWRPVKLAALTGIPFGISLAGYGLPYLWHATRLVQLMGTTRPFAIGLGVLLIVFLVVAFLEDWIGDKGVAPGVP